VLCSRDHHIEKRALLVRRVVNAFPAFTTILRAQYHGVVADGKPDTLIHKGHRSKHRARRYLDLGPGASRIPGYQHDTPFSNRDQTVADGCHIQQQGPGGKVRQVGLVRDRRRAGGYECKQQRTSREPASASARNAAAHAHPCEVPRRTARPAQGPARVRRLMIKLTQSCASQGRRGEIVGAERD